MIESDSTLLPSAHSLPLSPSPSLPPLFQAGSAHVRIRRDANEQLVLAHVTNRLLPLVSTLSVQIFKDDWSRPLLTSALTSSSAPPEGYTSSSSSLPPPLHGMDPLTSTPSKPSSSPPEFAFETPGRNAQQVVLPAPGQHRPYGGLGLPYGASPYAGMLSQGLARPGVGLGLGAGLGLGVGVPPSSQSYRTAFGGATVPLRFGSHNPLAPQSQYRQYRP
ncbi:zinc transporter 6 [Notothenia coriiceps]|uniref:Zinc transporter 6 n=1 Tax=Notothenia coriiceps TaxID=8208 RepID=A0A6I9PNI3_9TELE|nr:PREDICTED: zinc transporter 6 [Notothenia coriiceps]